MPRINTYDLDATITGAERILTTDEDGSTKNILLDNISSFVITNQLGGGTGIVKSTTGAISYLTDNSANWNEAYGWGDHAAAGYSTSGTIDLLSNVATARIIGRTTAGSGNSEELTKSAVLTFLNIEDGADVTDATNVAAAGAVIPTGTPNGSKFLRDDGAWAAISGGGDALVSNPLSQFAATTSAQLRGVLSDETGTGAAVFATSPTFVTPILGTPSSGIATNLTGSPAFGIANMTLDDTNLIVAPYTNLQTFADKVDHSLLKARGTGVHTSYVSTVAVGGTTFAQPEVFGEISSDQGYFDIHYTGGTGITVANLSAASTYVYIDNTGNLQQQTTAPTRQDWSRKVFTMRIAVNTSTNQIVGFEYLNNPVGHYANSMRDIYSYLLAQGIPFRKDQVVTGRADLGFDVSAGTLLELGGTGDIDNANIKSFTAVTNAQFFLATRTTFDAGGNTDLPKVWDNNDVLTALGSTTLVGHRLYRFSNGNFVMQYGQGNYANMTLAKSGVLTEDYVLNPILQNATFFGWWFVESTATTTNGTTLTSFVEYTIGTQGGVSNALSGAALKGNNASDFLDFAAVRTNIGINTTANQTDSSNKRFVTDVEKTVIGNTSNTNTGDQTIFRSYVDSTSNGLVGTQNASNAVFTVSQSSYLAGSVLVFVSGYSLSVGNGLTETTPASGIFTLDSAPESYDIIIVQYSN